jgi:xylulokinase
VTAALLGIDLGTSQAKALLCAPDGTVLGRGTAGYEISTPRDGWAETDPELWWRAVRSAVRGAVSEAVKATTPAGAEVGALAIAGQMHSVVLISERHVVLRPATLWLDRRASAELADYRRIPARLREAIGNEPSAGLPGPVLLWLARHEPNTYEQARWQLQPKDWLRLRLTGEVATDQTDASGTLLYDLTRDAWALDVVAELGLRTDLLPPIRRSDELAGHLLPEAAAELGLTPRIPVAIGAADTAASLLAADLPAAGAGPADSGGDGDEWALLTLGTGGQWIVPLDAEGSDAKPDPSGRTNLFRSADGGAYRLAGAQNVGVTLDWVRRTLGVSWADLYATAARVAPGEPVFHPWLVSEAGRSSGGWSGVTLAHGPQDLMRAALVGVAGLLRDRLEDLRAAGSAPTRVLLGGGGSRYPAWRDLLAETLDVPLYPASNPWLTARGATLLAAAVT